MSRARASITRRRATGGTNLLTSDSATFTSSIADWNETTGASNFDTAWFATDGGVLRVDVTIDRTQIAVASHRAGNANKVPVTAGATITLGADCKQILGTARAWRIQADFYDAADAAVSSNVAAADGTLIVGSYVTLSGPLVVPAGAAEMRLSIRWTSVVAGDAFLLDNAFVIA